MSISTLATGRLSSAADFARRYVESAERRLETLRYDLWHAADAGKAYDALCEDDPRRPDTEFTEATVGPSFRGLGWEDRWRR